MKELFSLTDKIPTRETTTIDRKKHSVDSISNLDIIQKTRLSR